MTGYWEVKDSVFDHLLELRSNVWLPITIKIKLNIENYNNKSMEKLDLLTFVKKFVLGRNALILSLNQPIIFILI